MLQAYGTTGRQTLHHDRRVVSSGVVLRSRDAVVPDVDGPLSRSNLTRDLQRLAEKAVYIR